MGKNNNIFSSFNTNTNKNNLAAGNIRNESASGSVPVIMRGSKSEEFIGLMDDRSAVSRHANGTLAKSRSGSSSRHPDTNSKDMGYYFDLGLRLNMHPTIAAQYAANVMDGGDGKSILIDHFNGNSGKHI
jgi:hypothetical protein